LIFWRSCFLQLNIWTTHCLQLVVWINCQYGKHKTSSLTTSTRFDSNLYEMTTYWQYFFLWRRE
jgi:hypothetical protein